MYSVSKWDPLRFSEQWPKFAERDRVLSWKTVEGMTLVEWDIAILAYVALSSSSKWGPVWASTQWPELFESGRILSWKTVYQLVFNYELSPWWQAFASNLFYKDKLTYVIYCTSLLSLCTFGHMHI